MSSRFTHRDLRLVIPDYDSELTDVVMDLQYLRRHTLGGSTPAPIFFQLKRLFHTLESINSARIEGNRTSIAEAIEASINPEQPGTEGIREIQNNEAAMRFIEEQIDEDSPISRAFVRELHKIVVRDLSPPPNGEGDKTPGAFRSGNVTIHRAEHTPPDVSQLPEYLDEFINFINEPSDPKFDLLRVAITHHRFAWIHPFSNGNGRVVRLITYAQLISKGFDVRTGRILNPSAVFCSDREQYYSMLSAADSGNSQAIIDWCLYVLKGFRDELEKIDRLLNYDFLRSRILQPALAHCKDRALISDLEFNILLIAIDNPIFQASDIEPVTSGQLPAQRSRVLRKMRENKLIEPMSKNGRKYVIKFSNSLLTRGLIYALAEEGFIDLSN